ncbi:MAG TPA: sensor histidine kinase [Oligoflexus sp.]|uniref:sensor histidine kinase n=1 Tax=Oligoflexus sp. TaxID=1971216 RepID=UPI002D4A8B29|nr:sensor histidine kinase [Oligoflexus sp.]HYX39126.1 sensor histidine kinase [Oligoflexus sp.]
MDNLDVPKRLKYFKNVILNDWTERVRKEVSAARKQQSLALKDHLPEFLENMVKILDTDEDVEQVLEGEKIGEEHGKQRFKLVGYSLSQIVKEYHIFRQTVFSHLLREDEYDSTVVRVVNAAVDRGISNAVEAFAQEELAEITNAAKVEAASYQDHISKLNRDRELRDQFVATLSHDLRNPIGSAVMALEILMEESTVNEDTQELFDIISRSLKRSEIMLRDLLDANRINSGWQLPLNVEDVELVQLLKDLVSDLSTKFGHRFLIRSAATVSGRWDAANLNRMLENIITNAVKYGDGKLPITITIDQDNIETEIRVHNFGNPISPDDQEKLFDPYTRAKTAEKSGSNGWGLGLTLVKAVAEAHGGIVTVKSLKDDGTTFTIVIPNAASNSSLPNGSAAL